MLTPLLQLLFFAVGLGYLAGAIRLLAGICAAPLGYEDGEGFHYGTAGRPGRQA